MSISCSVSGDGTHQCWSCSWWRRKSARVLGSSVSRCTTHSALRQPKSWHYSQQAQTKTDDRFVLSLVIAGIETLWTWSWGGQGRPGNTKRAQVRLHEHLEQKENLLLFASPLSPLPPHPPSSPANTPTSQCTREGFEKRKIKKIDFSIARDLSLALVHSLSSPKQLQSQPDHVAPQK